MNPYLERLLLHGVVKLTHDDSPRTLRHRKILEDEYAENSDDYEVLESSAYSYFIRRVNK